MAGRLRLLSLFLAEVMHGLFRQVHQLFRSSQFASGPIKTFIHVLPVALVSSLPGVPTVPGAIHALAVTNARTLHRRTHCGSVAGLVGLLDLGL